ncbi:Hypothetical protein I595_2889 [Croceitalea dokdonensis DOKDO 023]|uniref:Uncharacterized protein n=1 Tax=Croceitalea dokdonensis DOKDO 023 TaxID=1300341 RepID=A0A0P7AQ00_9FLAO|nr:Hypothetical protein I595_2889 [Croceitalea dokdonensis DOKDO 023]
MEDEYKVIAKRDIKRKDVLDKEIRRLDLNKGISPHHKAAKKHWNKGAIWPHQNSDVCNAS